MVSDSPDNVQHGVHSRMTEFRIGRVSGCSFSYKRIAQYSLMSVGQHIIGGFSNDDVRSFPFACGDDFCTYTISLFADDEQESRSSTFIEYSFTGDNHRRNDSFCVAASPTVDMMFIEAQRDVWRHSVNMSAENDSRHIAPTCVQIPPILCDMLSIRFKAKILQKILKKNEDIPFGSGDRRYFDERLCKFYRIH
jgi:hypothetical protein